MRIAIGAGLENGPSAPVSFPAVGQASTISARSSRCLDAGAVEDALATFLRAPPFGGLTRVERLRSNLFEALDYAIAIPVRNEEALLPRALEALATSMQNCPFRGGAVFVVNDTTDASFDAIERFSREREFGFAIVDASFDAAIRNAPHARRLALDIAAWFAPDGALLTSDADSHVGPLWVGSCLDSLQRGHALVCEDIRLDEAEMAELPSAVRKVGDAERAYFEASEILWQRWTGGHGGAFAYRASGASLAMTAAAYRDVGGLPLPHSGEDAALCAAILAAGYRVEQLQDIGTRTSARLTGRAAGGCGAALSHRAVCADPECDGALVPVSQLHERAQQFKKGLPPRAGSQPMRYLHVVRELAHARRLINGAD